MLPLSSRGGTDGNVGPLQGSPAPTKQQKVTDEKEMLEMQATRCPRMTMRSLMEYGFTDFRGLKRMKKVQVELSDQQRAESSTWASTTQGLPSLHTHSKTNFLLNSRQGTQKTHLLSSLVTNILTQTLGSDRTGFQPPGSTTLLGTAALGLSLSLFSHL